MREIPGRTSIFRPALVPRQQMGGLRCPRHKQDPAQKFQEHPAMLRSQTTNKSYRVHFACRRSCNPSACFRAFRIYGFMKKDLWKDGKGSSRRKERACFAVLLVLLLSLGIVIDRLDGQGKEYSAEI